MTGGIYMDGKKDNYVSFAEASKDFSKVVRMADKKGTVIITKNGEPCYVLLDYDQYKPSAVIDDSEASIAAQRMLAKRFNDVGEMAE
jgi:antitoxin Phd